MSAIEKSFVQIFEKKKRIIDQAHCQCLLFDQHLVSKLLIDGIAPPPWLSNPMFSSLTSDPKARADLNEDDLIFGALFSRAQSKIPISDHRFSQQDNVVATTDDGQSQSGLHSEFHALNRDINTEDGLSNLPDCSVNNVGRSSFIALEMDSTAISPQIQMESRISHCYNEPALSLAKLQRSKSRQRALELRHSAKAAKSCLGDNNKTTDVCASGKKGSTTSSPQSDHFEGSELAKVSNSNIQSCAGEEVNRGECLTQRNDQSNYSGRVTRSKRLALKPNSSNVISSPKVKEAGPQSNNMIKQLEPVTALCFSNGSYEAMETNKGYYQRREIEDKAFSKRVKRSRSTRETKCDNESLKLESSLAGGNRAEVQDSLQLGVDGGPTFFSKTCDYENECQRKTTKDGDCCSDKDESNVKIRRLIGSVSQALKDVLVHGDSSKSIKKSTQSPQPSVSQHSQPFSMPVVGSFHCKKAPDLCAVELKTNEGKSKSVSNLFVDRSSICSQSAACNSYHELEGAEIAAGRPPSSEKACKLDTEVAAAAASCRNTRALTTTTTEGSVRPGSSSNLDSRDSGRRHSTFRKSLLEKSLHAKTVVAENSLNTRENAISGANVYHDIDDRPAGNVAKLSAEFDVLGDKHDGCLESSPKVGLDVSLTRPPPSNFVKSVRPKHLDFDNIEGFNMNGITGADLEAGGQDVLPDKGTSIMLEPGCLDDKVTSHVYHENDKVTSHVYHEKSNFSMDTQLTGRQEATVREEGTHMKSCERHSEETDVSREPQNFKSSMSQSFVVQKELCPHTSIGSRNSPSSTNLLIPSQTACQNSSGSFPKENMESKHVLENINAGGDDGSSRKREDTSAAVTDSNPLENAVQTVNDFALGSAADMDESNISLTNPDASSGSFLLKKSSSSRGKGFDDEKDAGFSRKHQTPRTSSGSFASHMDHSCPQHKRRKIESLAERPLNASPSHVEKKHEPSSQRLARGNVDSKEDNQEACTEVQHLTSHQEDIDNSHVSDRTAEEMQNMRECQIMEGTSLEVNSDQKFNLDGRDKGDNSLLSSTSRRSGESSAPCLIEQGSSSSYNRLIVNSCDFGIGLSRQCTIGKNLDGEGISSGRIYLGETAMLLEDSSFSQGIQRWDLIATDETTPEIEGFIIQPDEAQPCIDGDHIELEKVNLSSNPDEYASILQRLSSSTFVHSPFSSSSNPYRLHKIPDLYQSLPNGLVEGMMGLRTSLPVNSESAKSFSDCLPNCKNQSTWDIKKACISPIQTLWDRINSKYGSSGKRESSKPELPCIDEENEAVDEIANTFQNRTRPEQTSSIIREPLAEITDNAKPSLVSRDDILPVERGLGSIAREFSFCEINNQEKQKLESGNSGRRRFTGKGKENQSLSRGTNHARRTNESFRNRSSRPKLSGKNSVNKVPTFPSGKSSCSNIVSNITSFIPLVQQKQAAEVVTGKRDIKVKALEAAEAAKRMAEKKENERKMKKEALKLERERIEQDNRKQLELLNKKKEEERKKREAELAAKKRQREEEERIEKERKRKRVEGAKQKEEEERIEKERKRKRVEEAKKKHQEREKILAKKEEKGTKCCDAVDAKNESKECIDGKEQCNILGNNREGNMKIPLADEAKESRKLSEAVNDCGKKEKMIVNLIKGTETDDLIAQNTIEEQSYDISPYKGSDDEDEDDDDSRDRNKFVPSWSSKQRLYEAVSSQNSVNPETIFPLQSFCNISEGIL